jgi:flagellar hook assembly protein FlgD
MIENYRSQLLWDNFMKNPEIQPMLDSIGFVPDSVTNVDDDFTTIDDFKLIGNFPNPFNPTTTLVFNLPAKENASIIIYNYLGQKIRDLANKEFSAGENKIIWNSLNNENNSVSSGIYLYKISTVNKTLYGKMILQK